MTSSAHPTRRISQLSRIRVGISGAVGCGKTSTISAIARCLDAHGISVGVVTNDVYQVIDAIAVTRLSGLPESKVIGISTGGCPHTAIRDDTTLNEAALQELAIRHPGLQVALLESAGDNITVRFARSLVDRWISIVDVAGGEKLPSKGGPGITSSDLLYINKVDLSRYVGASVLRMYREARAIRGDRPVIVGSAHSTRTIERLTRCVAAWAGIVMSV